MVGVIILLFLTVVSFIFSILILSGKNIILNDTYLRASKESRKSMNKKAYRLQSAIIFLSIAVISLLNALRALLHITWLTYAALAITVIAIIYVIISDYVIKHKKQ